MRVSPPATFVVMLLLTAWVSPAAATPISYSESDSGDLGQVLPAPTVFALDVGVNTVAGTIHFIIDGVLTPTLMLMFSRSAFLSALW